MGSPYINPTFGPVVLSFYWSATTYAGHPDYTAWYGYFKFGDTSIYNKAADYFVRAVRGSL
jgi:hypothetical protein